MGAEASKEDSTSGSPEAHMLSKFGDMSRANYDVVFNFGDLVPENCAGPDRALNQSDCGDDDDEDDDDDDDDEDDDEDKDDDDEEDDDDDDDDYEEDDGDDDYREEERESYDPFRSTIQPYREPERNGLCFQDSPINPIPKPCTGGSTSSGLSVGQKGAKGKLPFQTHQDKPSTSEKKSKFLSSKCSTNETASKLKFLKTSDGYGKADNTIQEAAGSAQIKSEDKSGQGVCSSIYSMLFGSTNEAAPPVSKPHEDKAPVKTTSGSKSPSPPKHGKVHEKEDEHSFGSRDCGKPGSLASKAFGFRPCVDQIGNRDGDKSKNITNSHNGICKESKGMNDSESSECGQISQPEVRYYRDKHEKEVYGDSLKTLKSGSAYLSTRELKRVCDKYQSYGLQASKQPSDFLDEDWYSGPDSPGCTSGELVELSNSQMSIGPSFVFPTVLEENSGDGKEKLGIKSQMDTRKPFSNTNVVTLKKLKVPIRSQDNARPKSPKPKNYNIHSTGREHYHRKIKDESNTGESKNPNPSSSISSNSFSLDRTFQNTSKISDSSSDSLSGIKTQHGDHNHGDKKPTYIRDYDSFARRRRKTKHSNTSTCIDGSGNINNNNDDEVISKRTMDSVNRNYKSENNSCFSQTTSTPLSSPQIGDIWLDCVEDNETDRELNGSLCVSIGINKRVLKPRAGCIRTSNAPEIKDEPMSLIFNLCINSSDMLCKPGDQFEINSNQIRCEYINNLCEYNPHHCQCQPAYPKLLQTKCNKYGEGNYLSQYNDVPENIYKSTHSPMVSENINCNAGCQEDHTSSTQNFHSSRQSFSKNFRKTARGPIPQKEPEPSWESLQHYRMKLMEKGRPTFNLNLARSLGLNNPEIRQLLESAPGSDVQPENGIPSVDVDMARKMGLAREDVKEMMRVAAHVSRFSSSKINPEVATSGFRDIHPGLATVQNKNKNQRKSDNHPGAQGHISQYGGAIHDLYGRSDLTLCDLAAVVGLKEIQLRALLNTPNNGGQIVIEALAMQKGLSQSQARKLAENAMFDRNECNDTNANSKNKQQAVNFSPYVARDLGLTKQEMQKLDRSGWQHQPKSTVGRDGEGYAEHIQMAYPYEKRKRELLARLSASAVGGRKCGRTLTRLLEWNLVLLLAAFLALITVSCPGPARSIFPLGLAHLPNTVAPMLGLPPPGKLGGSSSWPMMSGTKQQKRNVGIVYLALYRIGTDLKEMVPHVLTKYISKPIGVIIEIIHSAAACTLRSGLFVLYYLSGQLLGAPTPLSLEAAQKGSYRTKLGGHVKQDVSDGNGKQNVPRAEANTGPKAQGSPDKFFSEDGDASFMKSANGESFMDSSVMPTEFPPPAPGQPGLRDEDAYGPQPAAQDPVDPLTPNLQDLHQHGGFLFYIGFDRPKEGCNYSFISTTFMWIFGTLPEECV